MHCARLHCLPTAACTPLVVRAGSRVVALTNFLGCPALPCLCSAADCASRHLLVALLLFFIHTTQPNELTPYRRAAARHTVLYVPSHRFVHLPLAHVHAKLALLNIFPHALACCTAGIWVGRSVVDLCILSLPGMIVTVQAHSQAHKQARQEGTWGVGREAGHLCKPTSKTGRSRHKLAQ